MLTYSQKAPPAHLAPWIECLWTLEGQLSGEIETILPDGRMELMVHHASRQKNQAESFVTGQLTGPIHIQPTGPMLTHGARIRPAAAGVFLNIPAHELTGHFVTLKIQPTTRLPPTRMPDAANLTAGFSRPSASHRRPSPASSDSKRCSPPTVPKTSPAGAAWPWLAASPTSRTGVSRPI